MPIDDDEFSYDAPKGTMPWRQCISGFGNNTMSLIGDAMQSAKYETPEEIAVRYKEIEWHVQELVKWSRHFNRKSQELSRTQEKSD